MKLKNCLGSIYDSMVSPRAASGAVTSTLTLRKVRVRLFGIELAPCSKSSELESMTGSYTICSTVMLLAMAKQNLQYSAL